MEALDALKKENKGDLRGLVLDLRNNPGGVLNAAVGVSDAFLDNGKIVYTEGRVPDAKMEYNANKGDVLNGKPIVVLVNQGSASASEIVSGALQDHKRALIVGQKTFGKGSVQTVLPLDEKTAVKITTARYFTPSGRSIQAEGIKPDIELKPLKVQDAADDNPFEPLSEADLSKHLSNPTNKTGGTATPESADKAKEEVKSEEKAADKPEQKPVDVPPDTEMPNFNKDKDKKAKDKKPEAEDYQLREAVNILKGMDLVSNRNSAEVKPTPSVAPAADTKPTPASDTK
jgi:carboxyl-terminal processing protease